MSAVIGTALALHPAVRQHRVNLPLLDPPLFADVGVGQDLLQVGLVVPRLDDLHLLVLRLGVALQMLQRRFSGGHEL